MKPITIKIKELTIVLISAIVAFLINSKRILEILNLAMKENPVFTDATVPDLLYRITIFFIYSWLIIKLNLVWLDGLFNRLNRFVKLLLTIILNLIIVVSLFSFHDYSYELIFGINIPEVEVKAAAFGWFIVWVTLLLIVYIFRLQLKSRRIELEKEQFEQEKIKSELVAIKNQVNPHFLFNSLNTLNSVIRNNPENATDFVDKLSFMYRYILQSSDKNLVSLEEELEFLNSFTYLIKIRYGKRFELTNSLNLDANTIKIPVLSLQILIENAVKHNEISENNHLLVNMYNDDEFIIIKNKLSPRNSIEKSTGNGLLNLSKRYKILKNKDIEIYKNSDFIIKLPI